MTIKVIFFFLLSTLIISCGSDDSSGTSGSSTLVVNGSASATALNIHSLMGMGSPTSIKMTFHALAVSQNADCSNPDIIFDIQNSPKEVEMVGNNKLFSGSSLAGTYRCVIMRISDTIKFKVDAIAAGAWPDCSSTTTEYVQNIYRHGGSDDNLWIDLDGQYIDGTDGTDIVDIFANDGTPITLEGKSAHGNQMIPLNGIMTVPGEVTFFADFNGGIEGYGGDCNLEEGGFGFR